MAASVVFCTELTVVAPLAVVAFLSVEGTYRSFSTIGAGWKRGAHYMITEYWFRSL